jgi:hypothetical protein
MPLSFDQARAAAGKAAPQVAPRESGLAPAAEKAGVKPSMGGIEFDVAGAKDAGYSDDEIAAAVAKRANFDKDAAEQAGYSPQDIIQFLVPAAKGQEQAKELGTGIKEAFGRDPSKAGQLTAKDYAVRALEGATVGGAVGGTVGLLTGPGAIVTGTVGAIGGAVSGLLEAGAEDLGFGAGTQFLAGMVTPGAGLSTKVGQMIERKAVENTSRFAGMLAREATGIPGIGGLVKKGVEAFESKKPVNVGAIEQVLGIEGKAVKAGQTAEETAAIRNSIASRFEQVTGNKIPEGVPAEEHIYEEAANAINRATKPVESKSGVMFGQGGTPPTKNSFVGTRGFNNAATIEGNVNPSLARRYKSIFEDRAGNPLPGQQVLNNLRDFKYGADLPKTATNAARDARFAEGKKIEKYFNGWLEKQPGANGQPWEAHARAAFEQVAMNKAKDALPSLLEDVVKAEGRTELKTAANALDRQIWNLSKTPEGQTMFLEQLTGNLKDIPAKDARTLWNTISPEVEKRIITDPKKFQAISDIMNSAETPQDINRAVRLINGIITAGAISATRNL